MAQQKQICSSFKRGHGCWQLWSIALAVTKYIKRESMLIKWAHKKASASSIHLHYRWIERAAPSSSIVFLPLSNARHGQWSLTQRPGQRSHLLTIINCQVPARRRRWPREQWQRYLTLQTYKTFPHAVMFMHEKQWWALFSKTYCVLRIWYFFQKPGYLSQIFG